MSLSSSQDDEPATAVDGRIRRSERPRPLTENTSEAPANASTPARTHRDSVFAPSTTSESPSNAVAAHALGSVSTVRTLALGMLIWCAIGIPCAVLVPGTKTDKAIGIASLVVIACVYASIAWKARTATAVSDGVLTWTSGIVALGATGMALGAGMYSSIIGFVALGLFLFSSSARWRVALAFYAVGALSYAVIATLSVLGVVSSAGLLDPNGERSVLHRILNALVVEVIYGTSFAFGQVVRFHSAGILRELEAAMRATALRDALLHEVRAELDRAEQLGGAGQFTGQILGGFRLAEVIGRGGMGEIYAAHRVVGEGSAALKVIRRDVLSEPAVVQRFEREARIVCSLESRHIVEVYEVGGREAPLPFIAMERLYGVSLAAKLRTEGALSLADAERMLSEISRGVDVAHRAGIVHRDLNPNNLFCAEDGDGKTCWKVLDFGVSKYLDGGESVTVNEIVGTPQYMAPEQVSGDRSIDRRVDVYALTAILYRALSGRPAFANADFAKVLHAVATKIPEDPARFADLPSDVTSVLRVGLAKRREDRFDDAPALAEAYSAAVRGELSEAMRARALRLLDSAPWGGRA